MQRRDTFNTTTSTGFSSSQNTSDSFWRRYSNRASSQKNILNRESKKVKEDKNGQPLKVGEIINVENTRRNSMKIIAALNEMNDVQEINNLDDLAINDTSDTAIENNKQIQILNLDVKTNNVYSITLDVSEEGMNKFICVPAHRENKNIFIYDCTSKESFV
ncbi:Neuropeptide receptor A6-B [Operophtera brumata]|uniref:Neuropeptide receptor A6-B n=1 Tax=Operophtera brumata TaxID=104452 RepID=A0A0L7KQL7_OPEBR|nr:Neuropeptide receptor A6-B [Operophtera brumata]